MFGLICARFLALVEQILTSYSLKKKKKTAAPSSQNFRLLLVQIFCTTFLLYFQC